MESYFALRNQPFKLLYLAYIGLSLVFVKIPYWTVANALPSWRPRRGWPLKYTIMVKVLKTMIGASFRTSVRLFTVEPEEVEQSGRAEEYGLVWINPVSSLIVGEIQAAAEKNEVKPVRVAGYWYGKRGADGRAGQPADPDGKIIYELHGGGWVWGSASPTWDSAYMCNEMLKYAEGYDRAFQINYRLSQGPPLPPKNPFPAALIDAIAGYNYLVNDLGFKPSNILVTGESAGGNLALALVRYLTKNQLPSLPPPRAQLLHSPTVDWGFAQMRPESSMVLNANTDYVHYFMAGYGTRALLGDLPEDELYTNAWISPGGPRLPHVPGRFAKMPPTLIIVGDAEMTLDGVKTLRDRLVADCGEDTVRYVEMPDTTHIVMTLKWHESERKQAYEEFARWVRSIKEN